MKFTVTAPNGMTAARCEVTQDDTVYLANKQGDPMQTNFLDALPEAWQGAVRTLRDDSRAVAVNLVDGVVISRA